MYIMHLQDFTLFSYIYILQAKIHIHIVFHYCCLCFSFVCTENKSASLKSLEMYILHVPKKAKVQKDHPERGNGRVGA